MFEIHLKDDLPLLAFAEVFNGCTKILTTLTAYRSQTGCRFTRCRLRPCILQLLLHLACLSEVKGVQTSVICQRDLGPMLQQDVRRLLMVVVGLVTFCKYKFY